MNGNSLGVLSSEALTPQKRGPKSKRNPMEEEVRKLRRQNARLTEDLRKAHIIIDVRRQNIRETLRPSTDSVSCFEELQHLDGSGGSEDSRVRPEVRDYFPSVSSRL